MPGMMISPAPSMSSAVRRPAATLMSGYLESADGALKQQDGAAAKDFMQKAEHQIEILEKFLHL